MRCCDQRRQVLRRPPESTQYCSTDYQAELRKHGILISMSGRGNCFDNSMVETFFKTLKCELVWRTVFETRQEAERAIGRYSTGSTTPSGATPPSTSQARTGSKDWRPTDPMPLH